MTTSKLDAVFIAQRTPLLRTLIRMVKNPSVAEDLVQETYLRVATTLRERRVDHLEPFLFQTGRNLALDHLRHMRMKSRTLVEDLPGAVIEAIPDAASSTEDGLYAGQLLERLGTTLSRLTDRQQRMFILSRLHGLGHGEIAERLKVSPSTVQKELKLIMAICVESLSRLEPTP
ncbi:RNA polymerase sigma factor [Metapseudomonas furukawaii]|uniref:Sigma factor n=1 Tax=Metapseudomonas furukawaii TaxID=1149133 RepID=A0AAD1BXR9_METFU|nr:sigma-70 family RNA polymerase sigma factor [Pseudomonas furukawaii]ELS27649.1 RNA polymerase sigma-70 factor, ECF subfamily [Pseudomonas furukawaii]BAU73172.1 sigma factor [Pseudomonas furukawaii]